MVAQSLLESGEHLPENTCEAAIRPLAALPGPALQSACWNLVQSLAPSGVRQPLVSKVVRLVKNCLEQTDSALEDRGAYRAGRPRSTAPPEREVAFIAPVQRLARYQGFDAGVAISHVERLASASNIYTALGIMVSRCEAVRGALAQRFPELVSRFPEVEDSNLVEHHPS